MLLWGAFIAAVGFVASLWVAVGLLALAVAADVVWRVPELWRQSASASSLRR